MEMIGTVLTIMLVFIILILFLLSPGIIARLIFKKTDEIKLRNITAVIPATAYFSRQIIKGDVKEMVDAFSSGFGHSSMAITISLSLVLFLFTYIVQRFFVDMGIGLTDKILKKRFQASGPYGENAG